MASVGGADGGHQSYCTVGKASTDKAETSLADGVSGRWSHPEGPDLYVGYKYDDNDDVWSVLFYRTDNKSYRITGSWEASDLMYLAYFYT